MRRLVLSLLRVRMAMKAMSIKGYFLCLFLIESMSLRGVQFVCVLVAYLLVMLLVYMLQNKVRLWMLCGYSLLRE